MAVTPLRSVLQFNSLNWRPWSATRCVVGVGLPLLAGSYTGHAAAGVLASLGALYAGFNSFRGPYTARLLTMLLTTSIMSAMTFMGSWASAYHGFAAVGAGLVAFTLGLFATRESSGLLISIQGTAVFIVLAGIPASAAQPLGNCLAVLGGGLLQILLLTIIWPVNPRYPEAKALDRVYLSLASFVAGLRTGASEELPDAQALQEARASLSRLPQQPSDLVYALRIGETIRAGLVGLACADREIRANGDTSAGLADQLSRELELALRRVADAMRHGRKPEPMLRLSCPRDPKWREYRQWMDLLGDALERLGHPPNRVFAIRPAATATGKSTILRSLAFHHAARYGATIALAFAVSQLWHTPRAYWFPLTTCILLRADYATTLSRGFSRLLGTVVGVLVATGIASLHPSLDVLSVLIVAITWLACSVYLANYALFASAITCYAVFSISASAVTERAAAIDRLEATAAGAALAVAANFLWPIWQSRKVAAVLRDAVVAHAEYGKNVAGLFQGAAFEEADRFRDRARALRLEAERVVEASGIEPFRGRRHAQSWATKMMERLDENAARLLSLHAEAIQLRTSGEQGNEDTAARIMAAEADAEQMRQELQDAAGAAPAGLPSVPRPAP